MDREYDIDSDTPCPHCEHEVTHYRPCYEIGCDDGFIDLYEFDDPMLFDPGEFEMCLECMGTGVVCWCPKCGKDPREKPITEEEERSND